LENIDEQGRARYPIDVVISANDDALPIVDRLANPLSRLLQIRDIEGTRDLVQTRIQETPGFIDIDEAEPNDKFGHGAAELKLFA